MIVRSIAVLFAAAALAACAGGAGEPARVARSAGAPGLIPIEELFGNPEVSWAQVSPDGGSLAYMKAVQGRMNVFVRPIDGGAERLVTRDTVRTIPWYRWSADGAYILYLQDKGGDEGYHLFSASVSDPAASARDLTPFPGVEVEIFAAPYATPGTVLVTMNRRDPRLADAYRVDLATGALEMAAENPGTFLGYAADAAGRVRAAQALDSLGRYSLWARESESAPWRQVARYPVEDRIVPLRFHPDGRLYMTSNHGSDLIRLVLVDLATGAETVVHEDPLGEADLEAAHFDERTGEVLATVYVADTMRIYPHAPEVARVVAAMARTRPGTLDLGGSADRAVWVAQVNSPSDPGGTYLVRGGGEPELLFESRPSLRRYPLGTTRTLRYTTSDGLTIRGYLTLPRGEPGPRPLVLMVHGGPWSRDYWGWTPDAQHLADRGYAVLQLNYRGSTGFGKRFARAVRKEFAGRMHTDLLQGVRWAVEQGFADPERVAILGGSYGGYATLVGLTFTPGAFACGVDYSGPSDLVTLVESFPPSWGPFLPRAWYPFVGDPRDPADREDMRRRSPLFRADSARAPLLIFQGANDPRVTRAQSDHVALAMHRRGIPVTYLVAGNEGHGWGNRETALAVTRATELFLARCLGGAVQPTVTPEVDAALAGMTVDVDTLREAAIAP
jgi:dipeptidyl aminopeptidase/acylaminoacyl peptidase